MKIFRRTAAICMCLYTLAIPAVSYAESGKRDFRDESLKQEIRKIVV